jgi:hypothetical protein
MDPEVTMTCLRDAIESAARLAERALDGDDTQEELIGEVARIQELFDALDGWLSKGGFLPRRWRDALREGRTA